MAGAASQYSSESKGTAPSNTTPPPPRGKFAPIRDTVCFNSPLIPPYFLGGLRTVGSSLKHHNINASRYLPCSCFLFVSENCEKFIPQRPNHLKKPLGVVEFHESNMEAKRNMDLANVFPFPDARFVWPIYLHLGILGSFGGKCR